MIFIGIIMMLGWFVVSWVLLMVLFNFVGNMVGEKDFFGCIMYGVMVMRSLFGSVVIVVGM